MTEATPPLRKLYPWFTVLGLVVGGLVIAALHCPVLADPFYGGGAGLLLSTLKRHYKPPRAGERPLIGRLALHAESIEFPHPVTGAPLTIQAPLPNDFAVALKYLRKFAA